LAGRFPTPLGLVPTALLALLIDLKARREETWLIERFPEYALYQARTPRRFVPLALLSLAPSPSCSLSTH
jgi:protein-S-isoprenylcysteine O-methyltransferase Ste14